MVHRSFPCISCPQIYIFWGGKISVSWDKIHISWGEYFVFCMHSIFILGPKHSSHSCLFWTLKANEAIPCISLESQRCASTFLLNVGPSGLGYVGTINGRTKWYSLLNVLVGLTISLYCSYFTSKLPGGRLFLLFSFSFLFLLFRIYSSFPLR